MSHHDDDGNLHLLQFRKNYTFLIIIFLFFNILLKFHHFWLSKASFQSFWQRENVFTPDREIHKNILAGLIISLHKPSVSSVCLFCKIHYNVFTPIRLRTLTP